MNTVITVSRQFGSGGRLIGKLLAQKLGIPFYDKEIIYQAAEKSGLASGFIEENEQKRKSSFYAYAVPPARWGVTPNNFDSFEAKIYAAEADVIEQCAKGGACVIVGRCADYVLRGKAKCLNVFVYADDEARVKRVMEVYGDAPNEKKAQKLIRDTDRLRARHYRYYTDNEWGKSTEYDICVNSATIGIENCVEMLATLYSSYNAD